MSLIVCANDSEKSYNRSSNFNSAFSWINSLKQNMRLPPNSEVAVQSVKVNKNNDITIKRSNIFFQYWGKDLMTLKTKSTNSLQEPILSRPELTHGESEAVSINEFAVRMEKGMNEGLPHPDAYGLQQVTVNHDIAKDPAFQGYNLLTNYQDTQTATNIADDADFNNHTTGHTGKGWQSPFHTASILGYTAWDGTQAVITGGAPTTREWETSCLVNKRAPISMNEGMLEVDLLGLGGAGATRTTATFTTRWQVGLVRGLNGALEPFGMPDYYHAGKTTGFVDGSNLGVASSYPSFAENFYDVVVSCDPATAGGNNRLKIHMAVPDDIGGICMEEVEYFGNWQELAGATGGSRYNMSTNTAHISKLRIQFLNEQVIISVGIGADASVPPQPASYVIVGGYDKYHGAGAPVATNANVPKGINQSQWCLYPKVCVLGGVGQSLGIVQYGGVIPSATGYTFDYGNPKNCWFCRQTNTNSDLGRMVDIRPENSLSASNTYEPIGIAGANFSVNVIQLILAPSPLYYIGTEQANIQAMLGFTNRTVLAPAHGGTVGASERNYTYTSDTIPVFSASSKSLFVRLDNFTQNSLNAGVGRPSKILYHMPRFDTSNRDLGAGLYYEPQERAYLKLNNSDTLNVNQLNLSICDENEQLATDLIGRTIVVLHFKSPE